MLNRRLLSFFLVLNSLSIVFAEPTPTVPANVPNPAGVAHMKPEVASTSTGAHLTANFHMIQTGSKVTLSLLGVVTKPDGSKQMIEIQRLDDQFVHDATNFQTKREFDIDYANVNARLKQEAPNANLSIGPGTELFVYARWMNVPNHDNPFDYPKNPNGGQWNHEWGGPSRGGKIVLPGRANVPGETGFSRGGVTTSLDVANTIDYALAARYPSLKNGGAVGSRFEVEPKFHVDVNDLPRIEAMLDKWASDPVELANVFGPGWTMKKDTTYLGKPMEDTYMDHKDYLGAKIGMALRWRFGKGVGSWNYKPNDGVYLGGGISQRTEYQIDGAVDASGKPIDLGPFLDSYELMNPGQLIRQKFPSVFPSEFLRPSVFNLGHRGKYIMMSPQGNAVEFSLDNSETQLLDAQGNRIGKKVRFGQLEIEVDHLGAPGSGNVVTPGGNNSIPSTTGTLSGAALTQFLQIVPVGSNMNVRTPPVFHGEDDFLNTSPLLTAHKANFDQTRQVVERARDAIFPNNSWGPSGQKGAIAPAALEMISMNDAAPSVRRMVDEHRKRIGFTGTDLDCLRTMIQISAN